MKRNLVIGGAVAAVIVVAALVVILVPFGGPSDQEARQKADQLFVALREQGGQATYQAVEPQGEDGMVIKNLTIKSPAKATGGEERTITVEELRINKMDWKNSKNPDFADVEFTNMRVDGLQSNPQFKEFSTVTGLQNLVVSGHVNYRLDRDKRQVVVEPFRMNVEGMGEYTMSMTFEGIDVEQLRNAAQSGQLQGPQALGLFSSVQLRSLKIAYKDNGGVEKFLKFAAKEQNTTPDELRSKTLAQLNGMSQAMKGKLAQEALTAAQKFLKDPGTMRVVADPPSPVAVLPVVMGAVAGGANPAALDSIKSQLNLSITAE